MQKEKLYFKYNKGQERSEVVEKSDFEKSIFSEQYSQALRLIDSFLHNYQKDSCQILAFCGDRGEGKSSCLKTIHEILKNVTLRPTNSEEQDPTISDYLHSLEVKKIEDTKFEVLDIIDPAFFDKGHNVQELVVGQMYTEFRKLFRNKDQDRVQLNELLKKFESVKHCVTTLKKAEMGVISEYDELETLAYSMTLKKEIKDLISEYLKIEGKEGGKLVITVDDIDLNMEEAYRMCEQLRKYFSNEHTIIILAVKIDQLHQAVARALKQSSQPNEELTQSANIMAEKYLAKFLPAHARINMPNIFDISGRYLQIGDKTYDGHTIMDTILELIFQRTRYLFYNSMGVVSPLIPTNLRGFLQLLGLLNEMHDLDKYHNDKTNREFKRKLEENKHRFKNYFFIEWLRKLPQNKNLSNIFELINLADYTLFNKKVCAILSDVISSIEKRSFVNDEEDDEIFQPESATTTDNEPMVNVNRIIDQANFSYNVTIGDVFYIISMLEKLDLSLEQQNLLFFIKSLYSMRLYEAYDTVTEIQEDQYSDKEALHAGIYRFDSRLTDTNELQRLVGGSYFSFPAGGLLRISKDHNQAIDCCIIDTSSGINTLSEKAKKINPELWKAYFEGIELNGKKKEDFLAAIDEDDRTANTPEELQGKYLLKNIRAFRLMELFVLTVCQTITQKEMERIRPDKLQGNYRTNVIPAFLSQFKKTTKRYLMFDVLSPFSSLVNPKFSYWRWEDYIPGFYNTAIQSPWSLLRKMIGQAVYSRWGNDEYETYAMKESLTEEEQKKYLHILQSDAIIRNGEVLAAMYENINGFKTRNKDKSDFYNLPAFYADIASSNMSTYSVSSNGKNGYPISCSFLKAIEEVITDSRKDFDVETAIFATFNKVVSTKNKFEFIPTSSTSSKEGQIMRRLYTIIGDRTMNAEEIKIELSRRFPHYAKLSPKEKRTYINLKDGERKDLYGLLVYILSYEPRMAKWCKLLGI